MFGLNRKQQKSTVPQQTAVKPSIPNFEYYSQDEFLRLLRQDLMIAIWKEKNFSSAELIANEIQAVQSMDRRAYEMYCWQRYYNYMLSIGYFN